MFANNFSEAQFDADNSTQDELQETLFLSGIAFVFAAVAAWLISAFFISQFFAGAEIERMDEWTKSQYAYGALGLFLTSAIIGTQAVIFKTGRTRRYWIIAALSVSFAIFAETAATMQREQGHVQNKSTQSEVFKASVQAINQVSSAANAATASQQELADARAYLNKVKADGKDSGMIEFMTDEVSRLSELVKIEQQNQSALLSQTINQARALEYDETKHAAMIRFIAEFLGVSFVMASTIFAASIVITFESCFGYLGEQVYRAKRAIAIKNGEFEKNQESEEKQRYTASSAIHVQPDSAIHVQPDSAIHVQPDSAIHVQPDSAIHVQSDSAIHVQSDSAIHVQSEDAADMMQDDFNGTLKGQNMLPSVKDLKDWVTQTGEHYGLTISKPKAQEIAAKLLENACIDGLLMDNPEYRPGNRKPRYIIA